MQTTIRVEAKRFTNLATLKNIPSSIVKTHEQNYLRSVTQTNELFARIMNINRDTSPSARDDLRSALTHVASSLAEVKSYELFLTHLGGAVRKPQENFLAQIRKDFGSQEEFRSQFMKAAIVTPVWVAVAYDLDLHRLLIMIGDTPERLSVWNLAPVIVIEASPQTIGTEVGTDRERYFQSIMDHIDWAVVERNLEDAAGLQPAGKPF